LPLFGDLTESTTQHRQNTETGLKTPLTVSKPQEGQLHNPRRRFPYAEDEELVERLQQRMNKLCKNPNQRISKKTLRWLMVTYSKSVVKAAVTRVETLDYVDANPVGFLIVMLRSDSKRDELKALLRWLNR
jgi:hypothetical protein